MNEYIGRQLHMLVASALGKTDEPARVFVMDLKDKNTGKTVPVLCVGHLVSNVTGVPDGMAPLAVHIVAEMLPNEANARFELPSQQELQDALTESVTRLNGPHTERYLAAPATVQ